MVGGSLVPVWLPRNPKVADPLGGMVPFQDTLVTVTVLADWAWSPFQSWVICWPFWNVMLTCQPLEESPPVLVTVTSAWNPPGHWPTSW